MQCNTAFLIQGTGRRVNLLSAPHGIMINEWNPALPGPKNGGIFASSPFLPGRQLVQKIPENSIDTFDLTITAGDPVTCKQYFTDLLDILNNAVSYWVSGVIEQEMPTVYLEVTTPFSSAPLYSIIKDYRLPNEADYRNQPFITSVGQWAMTGISLVIERGEWSDTRDSDPIQLGMQSYNGYYEPTAVAPDRGFYVGLSPAGFEPTEELIANLSHGNGFTDCQRWDNSAAAWSGELMDTAPFLMFPAPADANDFIMFGIERFGVGFENYVPRYCALRILSDIQLGGNIGAVEYRNNAGAWAAIPGILATLKTSAPFHNYWVFRPPADWTLQTIAGSGTQVAYWIRINSVAAFGTGNPTLMINPWTPHPGYVTLPNQNNQGGTLYKIKIDARQSLTANAAKRLLMSIRSEDRIMAAAVDFYASKNFNPFIGVMHNVSFQNNYAVALGNQEEKNMTFGAAPVFAIQLVDTTSLVAGFIQTSLVAPVSGTNATIANFFYQESICSGRFRLFAFLAKSAGPPAEVRYNVSIFPGYESTPPVSGLYTSKDVYQTLNNGAFEAIDFGEVTLPPWYNRYKSVEEFRLNRNYIVTPFPFFIRLRMTYNITVNCDIRCLGIYLMPVDEWWADMYWPSTTGFSTTDGNWFYSGTSPLYVDQIGNPKRGLVALAKELDNAQFDLVINTPGRLAGRGDVDQRLFLLGLQYNATLGGWYIDPASMWRVFAYAQNVKDAQAG